MNDGQHQSPKRRNTDIDELVVDQDYPNVENCDADGEAELTDQSEDLSAGIATNRRTTHQMVANYY